MDEENRIPGTLVLILFLYHFEALRESPAICVGLDRCWARSCQLHTHISQLGSLKKLTPYLRRVVWYE